MPNNPYQIHKSEYFALSSFFSVMHYYSVEFPVTDAFHVESVHKTHSCISICVVWMYNMRINHYKFQGIFCALQSSQLHYEIYLLEFSDHLEKNVPLNVAISDREIIIDKVKGYFINCTSILLYILSKERYERRLEDYTFICIIRKKTKFKYI